MIEVITVVNMLVEVKNTKDYEKSRKDFAVQDSVDSTYRDD